MGTLELKSSLHSIIDTIDNKSLLEAALSILKNNSEAKVWQSLSEEQKQEVLEAFEESENESNLIPHEEVMKGVR